MGKAKRGLKKYSELKLRLNLYFFLTPFSCEMTNIYFVELDTIHY